LRPSTWARSIGSEGRRSTLGERAGALPGERLALPHEIDALMCATPAAPDFDPRISAPRGTAALTPGPSGHHRWQDAKHAGLSVLSRTDGWIVVLVLCTGSSTGCILVLSSASPYR
jgi:hypothetical protein